jgi:hypothetical protein
MSLLGLVVLIKSTQGLVSSRDLEVCIQALKALGCSRPASLQVLSQQINASGNFEIEYRDPENDRRIEFQVDKTNKSIVSVLVSYRPSRATGRIKYVDPKFEFSPSLTSNWKKLLDLDAYPELRWARQKATLFYKYELTPFYKGYPFLGEAVEVSFDAYGRLHSINREFVHQRLETILPATANWNVRSVHESYFWVIAPEDEGFRSMNPMVGWVNRKGTASMQTMTYSYAVKANGMPFETHSLIAVLSSIHSPAGLIGRFTKEKLSDPAWKPEHATQLAGKVLMRGATLVRLADAKKFVAPERWEQFAKLAEGQPKNKVMILDRGKKLCLIGRLDPDGEGIQVTIAGKDYHWIVKPEWFERS